MQRHLMTGFPFQSKEFKIKKKKVFFIVVKIISQGVHNCQTFPHSLCTTKALRMHHSLSTYNQVTTAMQYHSKNHTMVNLQKFSLLYVHVG